MNQIALVSSYDVHKSSLPSYSYENYSFYNSEQDIVDIDKSNCYTLPDAEQAVQINNVTVSYGSNKVLDGINMNVPVKKIYGLLGPSGCGINALL